MKEIFASLSFVNWICACGLWAWLSNCYSLLSVWIHLSNHRALK